MYVLGPSVQHNEPDAGPTPAAGRRGVRFHDVPTAPGGLVYVKINPTTAQAQAPAGQAQPDAGVAPTNIFAAFVTPVSAVPPMDSRNANWFFAAANKTSQQGQGSQASGNAAQSTPTVVASGVAITPDKVNTVIPIKVSGVKPGAYFVQIILEYPDPAAQTGAGGAPPAPSSPPPPPSVTDNLSSTGQTSTTVTPTQPPAQSPAAPSIPSAPSAPAS